MEKIIAQEQYDCEDIVFEDKYYIKVCMDIHIPKYDVDNVDNYINAHTPVFKEAVINDKIIFDMQKCFTYSFNGEFYTTTFSVFCDSDYVDEYVQNQKDILSNLIKNTEETLDSPEIEETEDWFDKE